MAEAFDWETEPAIRTVTARAWLPTRLATGEWVWGGRVTRLEMFQPDGIWNTGEWLVLSVRRAT